MQFLRGGRLLRTRSLQQIVSSVIARHVSGWVCLQIYWSILEEEEGDSLEAGGAYTFRSQY